MFAGAAKSVPLAGLIMETLGGVLPATTVIVPTMPRNKCGVQ